MGRLALGLVSLLAVLSLVPGVWFMTLSPRFLATSPGQTTTLRMGLLVVAIWLYPLTVLVSQLLAWRKTSLPHALAPLAHVAVILALAFLMGTFA